jgi:plastocyanin
MTLHISSFRSNSTLLKFLLAIAVTTAGQEQLGDLSGVFASQKRASLLERKHMKKLIILLAVLPVLGYAEPLRVRVMDVEGKPVGNVVVYLQNHETAEMPQMPHSHEIEQQDKKFAPYVSVIRQHEAVVFTNHDDITHHVYSFNGPARFEFRLQPGQSNSVMDFEEPGVIAMGCNIHDWMSGYVMVVDTPFYAMTNAEGIATFADVPANEYHLIAWHPQMAKGEVADRHIVMPIAAEIVLQLTQPMAPIPSQKSLDDFDFLEAY